MGDVATPLDQLLAHFVVALFGSVIEWGLGGELVNVVVARGVFILVKQMKLIFIGDIIERYLAIGVFILQRNSAFFQQLDTLGLSCIKRDSPSRQA